MKRREFLGLMLSGAATGAFVVLGADALAGSSVKGNKGMDTSEFDKNLSKDQYKVLREEATEAPFTSELLHEKRKGVYVCAACGNPLFRSDTKFDSGTGWPSFFEAVSDGAIGTSTDYKLGVPRVEVHCQRCHGHLGHVFDDGPADKTGKRFCMNGLAMKFVPDAK